jgi:hypothetical protein
MPKKFEYKTLATKEERGFWSSKMDTAALETHLNKLGFEGWELVSVVETNRYEGSTNEIIFVFKREI